MIEIVHLADRTKISKRLYWHFLRVDRRLRYPIPKRNCQHYYAKNRLVRLGEWQWQDLYPRPCSVGFHASGTILDAFAYHVDQQNLLCRVRLGGIIVPHGDWDWDWSMDNRSQTNKYAAQGRLVVGWWNVSKEYKEYMRNPRMTAKGFASRLRNLFDENATWSTRYLKGEI